MNNRPLVIYSTVSVPANVSNRAPVTEMLKNPFGEPMLIEEVRIRVVANVFDDLVVDLVLGREPIAQNVSVAAFGKMYDPMSAYTQIDNGSVSLRGNNVLNQIRIWRFNKPIWCHAGEYLTPYFKHLNYNASTTRAVQVSYLCQSVSGKHAPLRRTLPYAKGWIGASKAPTTDGTDKSTPTDLRNPFPKPLRVNRFTGAVLRGSPTGGLSHRAYSTYATVRMNDKLGRVLVRDQTPFYHLFQQTQYSLDGHSILPPNDYYILNLTQKFTNVSTDTTPSKPAVVMYGEREE